MHEGKFLCFGSKQEIMKNYGKGYVLEVHIDQKSLLKVAPRIKTEELPAITTITEAHKVLTRLEDVMEEKHEPFWAGLIDQFTEDGYLREIYLTIEQ
jgi:hypothetical protein